MDTKTTKTTKRYREEITYSGTMTRIPVGFDGHRGVIASFAFEGYTAKEAMLAEMSAKFGFTPDFRLNVFKSDDTHRLETVESNPAAMSELSGNRSKELFLAAFGGLLPVGFWSVLESRPSSYLEQYAISYRAAGIREYVESIHHRLGIDMD